MAVRVVPYRASHEPLVRELNERLAAAGSAVGFFPSAVPRWLAAGCSENVRREHFIALDDTPAVRAGYCLKQQLATAPGSALWSRPNWR